MTKTLALVFTPLLLLLVPACSKDDQLSPDVGLDIAADAKAHDAADDRDRGRNDADAAMPGDLSSDVAPLPDLGPDFTPPANLGRHDVQVLETRQIVPSAGLPPETPPQNANNNLDVIWHDGRVFLAWRTAPDHYASDQALIHVVSSTDEETWTFETTISRGRDVREPRFLELNGSLLLYVTELGTSALAFEPNDILVVERDASGAWSPPESLGIADSVLWRARTEQGTPYLLYYTGGGEIYAGGGDLDVHFDTTTDGRTLEPVDPAQPVIIEGGISETDFALDEAGALVGVSRNESGDETGFGSRVCSAPAGDLANWSCTPDPRKFDSPLMRRVDGETYLFARRNLTQDGAFDLGRDDLTLVEKFVFYNLEYKKARKRCAVWRWIPEEQNFGFVVDLPSRGDTCFPGAFESEASPMRLVVYNYSSPLDGDDLSWNAGQSGETRIYRHVVEFTVR